MIIGVLKSRSGFTLIEMMVAFLAFIMLLSASFAAFRIGTQSSVFTGNQIEINDTARILMMRIDSELQSICRYDSNEDSIIFEGINGESKGEPSGFDSLMFTTSSHVSESNIDKRGDVCTVMYETHRDTSGDMLGLFVSEDFYPGLHNDENDDDYPVTKLSETVIGMECNYLDGDSLEWVDEWIDNVDLPMAVKIDLVLKTSNRNSKPVNVSHIVYIPSLPEIVKPSEEDAVPAASNPAFVNDGGISDNG